MGAAGAAAPACGFAAVAVPPAIAEVLDALGTIFPFETESYADTDLPVEFVRSQIGLVQQEPFLFNGTVRQNILYSDLTAGHERVEAASRAARAHDFIMRLPEGYDSWIGERGVKISVGEKQRV